jgi:hypothetical protein
VPLVISTDYKLNFALSRSPKALVIQQIISDLKDAQNLLNTNYVDASIISTTDERVRPNKWAATALLARTYLYIGDWANAEAQATNIISNTGTYNLVNDLNGVFLANSKEAIWQLQPVTAGENTQDAIIFVLTSGPNDGLNPVYLSSFLLQSFEVGDARFVKWIGIDSSTGTKYYYPFKYKQYQYGSPVTEYAMVFRLAEQYLIRAEAKAQQGNMLGAASDLNVIRSRAGLSNTSATTQSSLVTAILHERQVELFSEWGHRWLDLKRTGTADVVMSNVTPQKGGTWSSNWQLYPISIVELQNDINLVQNPGY